MVAKQNPITLVRTSSGFTDKRSQDLEEYERKFAKRPMGVHGEELPKFSDHLQDYWKLKEGYIENPYVKSKEKPPSRPISQFSRLRVKSSSVDGEITAKPNHSNPFPHFNPSEDDIVDRRTTSRQRFSEEMNSSRPGSVMSGKDMYSIREEKSRPMSVAGNFKNSKRYRPGTAKQNPKETYDKCVVRSSGFF